MRVTIAGARLAGFTCTEDFTNAGYTPIDLKRQEVLSGKVVAGKDKDVDEYQTDLQTFFGPYPNRSSLFQEWGFDLLLKSFGGEIQRSVNQAVLKRPQHKPGQTQSPTTVYITGDDTKQRPPIRMEGIVLSGKLTAQAIVNSNRQSVANNQPIGVSR